MAMRYLGLTPYQYKRAIEKGKTLESLIKYGTQIIPPTLRKAKTDRSRVVTFKGVSYTLKQWYYWYLKGRLPINDYPMSYKEFAGRYRLAVANNVRAKPEDAFVDFEDSLYADLYKTAKRATPEKIKQMQETYLDLVHEQNSELKMLEWRGLKEQPEDPSKKWFGCLLADTRLQWLFYENYDEYMAIYNKDLDGYKQANVKLREQLEQTQLELAQARTKLKEKEQELADVRRLAVNGSKTIFQQT